jgi:hypothetical protein
MEAVASLTKEGAKAAVNKWGPLVLTLRGCLSTLHRSLKSPSCQCHHKISHKPQAVLGSHESGSQIPTQSRIEANLHQQFVIHYLQLILGRFHLVGDCGHPWLKFIKESRPSEELGKGLEDIRDQLAAQTVPMVQGWGPDGFAGFVYEFIKTEIRSTSSSGDGEKHWYYLYHPDTTWHPWFQKPDSVCS